MKTTHKLIQNYFCQLPIFAGSCHIIFVAYLKDYLIESFFLFAITNLFIVIFNASVFTFLFCVEFC